MRILFLLILAVFLCFPALCLAQTPAPSDNNTFLLIPSSVRPPCTGPIKDGIDRQYYSDGKVYDETTCQNSQLHGLSRQYTPEGTLWSSRNFKNGKLDGPASQYDKTGKLIVVANYKDGQLVEPVIRYDKAWQAPLIPKPPISEKAANFVDEDKKIAEFIKTDSYKAASKVRQSGSLPLQRKRDLTVERHPEKTTASETQPVTAEEKW